MIFASRVRMPLLPLARLDRHGLGFAVHDLHQPVQRVEQIGAFLDGGAVGCCAGDRDRLEFSATVNVSRGL